MKLLFLFPLIVLFLPVAVFSADCSITTTLKIGSMGKEVRCLQEKLGIIVDGRFGPLTRAAVHAFQAEKGLVVDGIFGPLSNKTLTAPRASLKHIPVGCTSTVGYSSITGTKCNNTAQDNQALKVSNSNENPNLTNLDQFIALVIKVNKENGASETELTRMIHAVRETAINSNTDFNKEFKELLVTEDREWHRRSGTGPSVSIFQRAFVKTFSFFGINPRVAHADGLPFGGSVVYSFFCGGNGSWMIGITSLPPTYVVLLTYIPGTQGFASHNIPYTTWLLGTYKSGGECVIPGTPPVVVPTQGTITPVVGSSPL